MRVSYLSSMTGYYGGEVHLVNLASGMRQLGHEVSCIVKPGSDLEGRLKDNGVPVYCLPLVDWFDPMTVARLGHLLRRLDCQILHSHMPRDYFIAAMATLGSDVVNIGTRHLLQHLSHGAIKRPFMKRFAQIIAVSNAVGESLIRSNLVPASRISVIHNGIAPDRSGRLHGKQPGRLQMLAGIDPGDPVVGFVGRICPAKGLETLILAARELLPLWPGLKILIVGDDGGKVSYQRRLEQKITSLGLGEVVKTVGYVNDAACAGRELDVQVVCSMAEPFGMVTIEAMNQMCPVVVTNTGGSPEIVRDGVEGFLVPPGDHEILARRLDVLLGSAGLRREMGLRGKERVVSSFPLDKMVHMVEMVYRKSLVPGLVHAGNMSA
jgi:glycosyltransferase involved in cell wall biosynthesis